MKEETKSLIDGLTKEEDSLSGPLIKDSSSDGGSALVEQPRVGSKGRKLGRPKKEAVARKKKETRGRPPGEAARIAEFKARLMGTSGDKVIRKAIEVALTDGHPAQSAMLKLCMDRLLPVSLFEKDAAGQKSAITINITGINDVTAVNIEQEPIKPEIEYEDVEFNDEP